MWKYLKAAFTARPRLPLVGALPVNLLMLAGFAILGLGHPGFWFLGLGAEIAYLFLLATSERFRNVVDSAEFAGERAARSAQNLLQGLPPEDLKKIAALKGKLSEIMGLYDKFQVDEFTVKNNAEALASLIWSYVRLVVARQSIREHLIGDPAAVGAEAAAIEEELKAQGVSAELRASKEKTLDILRARIENLKRRDQSLDEIESEITRIEAQFDLALENAAMSSRPQSVSSETVFDVSSLASDIFVPDARPLEIPDEALVIDQPGRRRRGGTRA